MRSKFDEFEGPPIIGKGKHSRYVRSKERELIKQRINSEFNESYDIHELEKINLKSMKGIK